MKYRGKKALMKCCKSCQNKKRIRCIGQPKIYNYQGYKFCTECTRTGNDIEKSFKSLNARINLNKRIKYVTSETTEKMTIQSEAHPQIIIPQLNTQKINESLKPLKAIVETFRRIISNSLKGVRFNIGKIKET